MTESVVVYRTQICPYCVSAARLLRDRGIPFTEIDVSNDPEKRKWLREVTGQTTVPQIFIHNQSVGGFTDLAALDRRGELRRMLEQPAREL